MDSHYLVAVLCLWICYGLGLTCTLYYFTKPQLVGTSDYYINLVRIGAGCKMTGPMWPLHVTLLLGKLLTLTLAVFGELHR